MGSELLRKEEEYRKMNEELEERSKYLLKEADTVRKMQDNLSIKENLYYSYQPLAIKNAQTTKSNHHVSYKEMTKTEDFRNLDEILAIPSSVDEMGAKGMGHFYRAKLRKMQEDLEGLQTEIKNKNEEYKKVTKENLKLAEEKEKWFQLSTSAKSHASKLDCQVSALSAKVQNKESENVKLRKELEELQRNFKSSAVNTGHLEVQINKAHEESEKLRGALRNAKQEEKDLKDVHKKQINDMTGIIKRIEKHRNELLCGFKKQLQLIDNLKRQKALIEDFKLTEKLEADFMKILDWNVET